METNNPNLIVVAKKTKGRRKIEMKKITDERQLQVSFTKRRNGIFKKASELSILCGVEIAIIVFSPTNRVYSFGSPNVDSVIQRYTGWVPPPPLNIDLNVADLTVDERELYTQLTHLSNQITMDMKRLENLDRLMKVTMNQFWWANPIESMNMDQLKKYKNMVQDLKTHVNEKRKKLFFETILTQNSPHIFTTRSSLSSVNGPVSVHSMSLMQNDKGVIDGNVIGHHHFNMNG